MSTFAVCWYQHTSNARATSNALTTPNAMPSQVAAEGGLDAPREVDALYRSLDALERRARAWAERRQQLLLDAADPIAAGKLPSAQEAGAAAAAIVSAVRWYCCVTPVVSALGGSALGWLCLGFVWTFPKHS